MKCPKCNQDMEMLDDKSGFLCLDCEYVSFNDGKYGYIKNMSSYSLYIDDERMPSKMQFDKIVRSYDEAIDYMTKNGCPNFVSFDHDLGTGKSGYAIAKWMTENDMDMKYMFIPSDFEYNIHSGNNVGRDNIQSLFDSYLKFRGTVNEVAGFDDQYCPECDSVLDKFGQGYGCQSCGYTRLFKDNEKPDFTLGYDDGWRNTDVGVGDHLKTGRI